MTRPSRRRKLGRKLSRKGVRLITSFEGLRLHAYRDPVGILTIGYGHTGHGVWTGRTITKRDARRLFRHDVAWAVDAVRALRVPLTQGEFDALVSITFNCGPAILGANRTIGAAIRHRDYRGTARAFPLYTFANGHRLPGLVRRRRAEQRRFKA